MARPPAAPQLAIGLHVRGGSRVGEVLVDGDGARVHRVRLRQSLRVMLAMYCGSYDKPPAAVTLDIDDTLDVVHGHQQDRDIALSLEP